MFRYKKLELLLLKNTVMSVLPMVLLLIAILCGMSWFHVFEHLRLADIDTVDQLEAMKENHVSNAEMTLERADCLGYDYYLDGKKSGSYYYSFMDDTCVIFLIDSTEEVLTDYKVRGKVMYDNTLYHYILEQCAKDMDMTSEQLQNFTYAYVISEIDYPALLNDIMKLALIFMITVTVLFVIEAAVWTLMPWRNPQIRKIYGVSSDPKYLVADINKQLSDSLRFQQGNVSITKRYLIVSSLFKTDIIRIRDIGVVSKHKEGKRSFLFRNSQPVYKLIISNSASLFYEYEFTDEAFVDAIIPYIQRKPSAP